MISPTIGMFKISLYLNKFKPHSMKFYTVQEAQYLIAFYSNVERIECQFELVHENESGNPDDIKEGRVGILCVDKTTEPPLVTDIDEVVKGLELTPTRTVLEELEQL